MTNTKEILWQKIKTFDLDGWMRRLWWRLIPSFVFNTSTTKNSLFRIHTMKTFSLLTFFLTCLLNLSAQDSTTIIITDSSTINIFYYNLIGKFVKETYNDKDLVHHLWYYTDYTTLKSDSYIYKTKRESVGLAKFYDANGKLKVIINNNNQTWIPVDTLRYPYYKLLCVMKEKADSILKKFIVRNL